MEGCKLLPKWLAEEDCTMLLSIADIADWQDGRQESGYRKADLLKEQLVHHLVEKALRRINDKPPVTYDAWIIHCPPGSSIPKHTDPAPEGLSHKRLNAIVQSGVGGALELADKEIILSERDAYLFRPDLIEHSVQQVHSEDRLVFSVGAYVIDPAA